MNTEVQSNMVFCRGCGKQIHHSAVACLGCGAVQSNATTMNGSDKRILPVLLLCFFLGWLGVHRFMSAKSAQVFCNCLLSAD